MRTPVRVAVVAVLLLATALYVHLNPPRRLELGPEALKAFPLVLGDWRGEELTFSDVVTQELDAVQAVDQLHKPRAVDPQRRRATPQVGQPQKAFGRPDHLLDALPRPRAPGAGEVHVTTAHPAQRAVGQDDLDPALPLACHLQARAERDLEDGWARTAVRPGI